MCSSVCSWLSPRISLAPPSVLVLHVCTVTPDFSSGVLRIWGLKLRSSCVTHNIPTGPSSQLWNILKVNCPVLCSGTRPYMQTCGNLPPLVWREAERCVLATSECYRLRNTTPGASTPTAKNRLNVVCFHRNAGVFPSERHAGN